MRSIALAKPESMGISSRRLERIAAVMETYIADKTIPGAILLLARHGQVVYWKAFGKADEDSPLKPDALFRIASMSKPILGAAVMQLFDDGRILLTDPISAYIPEFSQPTVAELDEKGEIRIVPAKRAITIHDLLTMTSGMIDLLSPGGKDPSLRRVWEYVVQRLLAAGVCQGVHDIDLTVEQHVRSLSKVPLAFHPGEAFNYGNNGCFLLARVVESVSGLSIDRYLLEHLFTPLGMEETSFYPPEALWPRLAQLYYSHDARKGKRGEPFIQPEYLHPDGYNEIDPRYSFGTIRKYYEPGGGLHSTAVDWFRFAQMLANGGSYKGERILSREAVSLMTMNQIGGLCNPITGNKWGFLLDIQGKAAPAGVYYGGAGTYGWQGLFGTKFWVNPNYDTVLIFMTHAYWSYDIFPVHQRLVQVVNSALD